MKIITNSKPVEFDGLKKRQVEGRIDKKVVISASFVSDISSIIEGARSEAVRTVEFYCIYPIASALRSQLNWFQYRLLILISGESKRELYELESVNQIVLSYLIILHFCTTCCILMLPTPVTSSLWMSSTGFFRVKGFLK